MNVQFESVTDLPGAALFCISLLERFTVMRVEDVKWRRGRRILRLGIDDIDVAGGSGGGGE